MNNQFTNSFLSKEESVISQSYLNKGYYVGPVADQNSLDFIQKVFINIITNELNIKGKVKPEELFNKIHNIIDIEDLNNFRLNVIRKINEVHDFRKHYYQIAKPYLDLLVGNELVMQAKVNLSIQFPDDDSSLLPTHADTWSGDSPFEVVVWIPLVDCYKTKSMYILPPNENEKLNLKFQELAGSRSEDLFQAIKNKVEWMRIDYGNVLIFNNGLPHGNRVNLEEETRWTMNCRFKGVYTPYWDKKIGSFFEPITLRAASISGMNYKLPKLK